MVGWVTYKGRTHTVDEIILSLTSAAVVGNEARPVSLPLSVGQARALARMLEQAKAQEDENDAVSAKCRALLEEVYAQRLSAEETLKDARSQLGWAIVAHSTALALFCLAVAMTYAGGAP